MRWLVGDLQGCARPFERLLRAIRFDPESDEVWCLGDIVNRGPDSAAAIRLWLDTGGRGVIGNHDVHLLRAAAGDRPPRGDDTFGDVLAAPDRDRLLAAIRAMPVLVRLPGDTPDGRDVWAVHAGLDPRWSDLDAIAERANAEPHDDAWLDSPLVSIATRIRCCTPDGEMVRYAGPPGGCPAGHRPWDEFYGGDAWVVHGHWARRGYHRSGRVIGLDSGCVYGGPLTAWCQDEDRIVQVPGHEA